MINIDPAVAPIHPEYPTVKVITPEEKKVELPASPATLPQQ